jgi:murein DD-endopeptidase MepM/ murein hydrolase activator NlpD
LARVLLLKSQVKPKSLLILLFALASAVFSSPLWANITKSTLASWRLPVNAEAPITSCYGPRDLAGKYFDFHEGVDFAVKTRTPVNAVASGRVIWRGYNTCSGRTIVIEHQLYSHRKNPHPIFSTYRHLRNYEVEAGQWVISGQLIGLSGASGQKIDSEHQSKTRGCVMGPHLHLEFSELNPGAKERDFEHTLARTSGHYGGYVSPLDPGLFLAPVRRACPGIFAIKLPAEDRML